MIWANLLHLSYNFWNDREVGPPARPRSIARPYLRFDEPLFHELTQRMSEVGFNAIVLDLGDGVAYESHPEIGVEGAWAPQKLRAELARLRELGLEPFPKLNFSAGHDIWLGEYSRMVSTQTYYAVCADIIAEVGELFDQPRLFHLGMDEETAANQSNLALCVIRQHELWWHDLNFLADNVRKTGARPWVWSDYVWNHPDAFLREMPRDILQSDWVYTDQFEFAEGDDPEAPYAGVNKIKTHVESLKLLEDNGFDQIPTGSNFFNPVNFEMLVPYCQKLIAPERLHGFLMTPWNPTVEESRAHHFDAIEQAQRAITAFYKRDAM